MSKFLKFFCKACKSPFYTAYKAKCCINCGSTDIISQGCEKSKSKSESYDFTDDDFILDEISDMDEEDGF